MRVHINGEEWYPVHDIFEAADGRYEIPDEVVERYNAAKGAHQDAMGEIDTLMDSQIRGDIYAEEIRRREQRDER